VAARRPAVDRDAPVGVGIAEHADIRAAEGLEPQRRALRDVPRRLDLVVEHRQDPEAARFRRAGDAHGTDEVHARVGAQAAERPLRAHDDDRHVDLRGQIQEVRRFLERRGAVRDDDAIRALAPHDLVDQRVELQPVFRADGRAADGTMAHGHDVGDRRELRNLRDELVGLELLRVVHVLPDVE
jgi:hypothetical protein